MSSEPQATTARLYKNPVLMDSRKHDLNMGVLCFRSKDMRDKRRSEQLQRFTKAYNMACDSIRIHGILHYAQLIKGYTHTDDRTLKVLHH